jgi:hypothetical protein
MITVRCQYQPPNWTEAIFVPVSVFDEKIAPGLSERGRTVYRPANTREWANLLQHVPLLVKQK